MSDRIKVVICDDEQMALNGTAKMVETFTDYEVCGKGLNGREGLELIEKFKPDIVITDIKMPIYDGLELMNTIEENNLPVTVIVISAYDDNIYLRKAVRNPHVFDYLLKPVLPDDLTDTLKEAVAFHQKRHHGIKNENDNMESKDEIRTPVVAYCLKIVSDDYGNYELNLNYISDKLNITPNYLSKCFKRDVGESFTNYLNNYRINKAKDLLKEINTKINDVASSVGFVDASYFDKVFKQKVGISPLKYRQNYFNKV